MKVLLDTGPLVAWLKADDGHHRWAVEAMAGLPAPLLTCEAVLSEAVYLLRRTAAGGNGVFELLRRGALKLDFRLTEEATAIAALIGKYGSERMDLADACLVRMSELHADCVVLTIDSDFRDIYRRHGRKVVPTMQPERRRR